MIGLLEIQLYNNGSHSLKEKRRELNRLIDKLHADFKVATAEVGSQDKWQRAELAIITVSNSPRHNSEVLDKIVERISHRHLAWQILDYSIREVY